MKNMIAAFAAVLALAVSAPAQEKKGTEAPNVTGTWNMGLQGGHVVPVALTLSGTVEGAAEPTTIEIAGTLNEDGSMEGSLNGSHGKVAWTAERLKERK